MIKEKNMNCKIIWHKTNLLARIPTKRDTDAGYDIYTIEDGVWMIDSVSTREEFRGKGLATKVLKAGIKQKKVDFSLHVNKNNTVAFNLYKKLGFKINSTHPYQLDGSFFMTKSQKTFEKVLSKLSQCGFREKL